jgi:hypothetical protein
MKKSYLMITIAIFPFVFSNWRFAEKDNQIKSTFIKNNLIDRLEDKVNEKLKIVWQPVWEKGSYQELNNLNTRAYIPILPNLKDQMGKTVDGKFEMRNTTRYLYVEKKGSRMEFYIRTVIGENQEYMTSASTFENFTGTVLTKSLSGTTSKVELYHNGSKAKIGNEPVCVYWTVCTWVLTSASGGCSQYVTTTSPRSAVPYAFPCTDPGTIECTYFMVSSHVEQYCE